MECERCGGTGTRCTGAGQCNHDGIVCFDITIDGIEQNCGEYEAIICPDCHGTGTKSEPDERIVSDPIEILEMMINRLHGTNTIEQSVKNIMLSCTEQIKECGYSTGGK